MQLQIPWKRDSFEGIAQVLHGCRQFVPWGVPLSGTTNATPIVCYICHTKLLRLWRGGRRGRCQVSMVLIPWAAHMLQWEEQWVLRTRESKPISQIFSQLGLKSAIRLHERGIGSNRGSVMPRWIRSCLLHTPPVKPTKSLVFEPRCLSRESADGDEG